MFFIAPGCKFCICVETPGCFYLHLLLLCPRDILFLRIIIIMFIIDDYTNKRCFMIRKISKDLHDICIVIKKNVLMKYPLLRIVYYLIIFILLFITNKHDIDYRTLSEMSVLLIQDIIKLSIDRKLDNCFLSPGLKLSIL